MKTLPFVSVFLAWQGFGTLAASVAVLLMVPVAAQAADPIAPLNPALGRSLSQPWSQPLAKRPAQLLNKQLNPCESFSYLYTEEGRCIDLSYMNKPPEPRLVTQLMSALQAIGVGV
ncbi:MAG: hypothetical protein VKK80_16740, partial [Prochlorothrix sp.]|nr:hypothetical protein [Prochlorothrix sp.]